MNTTTYGPPTLIPVRTYTQTLSQDIALLSKDGNLTTVVGLYGSVEVNSKYKAAGVAAFINIPLAILCFLVIMGFNCA